MVLDNHRQDEFSKYRIVNSFELAHVEETNYLVKSLINFSNNAKEIKESMFKKFMVTYGSKRLIKIKK